MGVVHPEGFITTWLAGIAGMLLLACSCTDPTNDPGPRLSPEERAIFEQIANHGRPLIDAIRKYEADHGVPPQSLSALVSEYSDTVSHTGNRQYPEYHYVTVPKVDQRLIWTSHQWWIVVDTSRGPLNFDRFVYFPTETYPHYADSGYFEEINSWAYYHE